MKNRIINTGTAPSHWASYFINGDSSGLDETDIRQANQFAEWLGADPVSCEDAGFMWTHDAMRVCGTLAADCQEYSAIVDLVPVLFRKMPGDDVTAVFPTLPGAPGFMTCYAHIGQHGSCGRDWYKRTIAARPDEYAALKRELESAPFYYKLRVYQRMQPDFERMRQAAERRAA